MSTKLDRLLEKEARLKAQIQTVRARERIKKRKLDTRRKILIGAVVLKRVNNKQLLQADLNAWLDAGLTRPQDRKLFSL